MRVNLSYWRLALLILLLGSLAGMRMACIEVSGDALSVAQTGPGATSTSKADLEKADFSVLFVGNSHTLSHDLPSLVARMIEFRHPGKKVVTQTIGCAFLEDAAKNPACMKEIKERPWKHVVLQAQKISMSGKFKYSQAEGIEMAKLARERKASAIFYAEWGLKGIAGDGERQAKVYREMAKESGASVAPVAKAWDLALAKDASLPLHSIDGNHQSEVGAFLTACVLYGQITGESPLELAKFEYKPADAKTRKLLAECADAALKPAVADAGS